jgi:hypothetical protein
MLPVLTIILPHITSGHLQVVPILKPSSMDPQHLVEPIPKCVGMGFAWVGYGLVLSYPWVTHAMHYEERASAATTWTVTLPRTILEQPNWMGEEQMEDTVLCLWTNTNHLSLERFRLLRRRCIVRLGDRSALSSRKCYLFPCQETLPPFHHLLGPMFIERKKRSCLQWRATSRGLRRSRCPRTQVR